MQTTALPRDLLPAGRHRAARRESAEPVIYAVRPSLWANPFEGRPRIGRARAAILYRHWLAGTATPHVLRCAGFGFDEIAALGRWRSRIIAALPGLRAAQLRCGCSRRALWCHLAILRELAGA